MLEKKGEKHTVAWFKLAEFIARKEKERALGIYRLLMHSLSDKAFAQQLEGDILYSFEDKKASASYLKAALIYESNAHYLEAALLYEHLIRLTNDKNEYAHKMLECYLKIGRVSKVIKATKILIEFYAQHKRFDVIDTLLVNAYFTQKILEDLYEYTVLCFCKSTLKDISKIKIYLERALELKLEQDEQSLQSFFAKIKALNMSVYKMANQII